MAQYIMLTILVAGALIMPAITTAGDKPSKKSATVKEVKSMSEKDQTALALSGAPPHIAKEAGIMIYGADGKLTETKKSANGFTCIPSVMNLPTPDPMCMDAAVQQSQGQETADQEFRSADDLRQDRAVLFRGLHRMQGRQGLSRCLRQVGDAIQHHRGRIQR